ncbi:MAG: hypothetical protein JXC36_06085 [Candidatus Atribacteria bacterium]|nr:hypothetical protein [Candidatus Atribacteria bacterium]
MSNFFVTRELMRIYKLPFVSNLIDKVCSRKAIEEWQKHYDVAIKVEIPENLKSIFDTKKKNEQINLLKGLSLTPDILFSFIIYAWNEQGYSFSQFHIEHQHKGVKKEELPTVIHIKDGDVETVGETPLTKGQQKQVVENRKVVVAKIFDKGDEWHCFFVTYDSLKGKEPWKNGQPHFHYISDKFGIKRNEVIKRLKDRKYNLGSLPHIDLND